MRIFQGLLFMLKQIFIYCQIVCMPVPLTISNLQILLFRYSYFAGNLKYQS